MNETLSCYAPNPRLLCRGTFVQCGADILHRSRANLAVYVYEAGKCICSTGKMPPNTFSVRGAVEQTLKCISSENGAFAFSGGTLKANKFLLESVKALQKSGLHGEIPSDLQYLLGDFEIEILESSINIHPKAEELIKLLKLVREAVEDNTRPTEEFLEQIKLSEYAETLSGYETVEDFTDEKLTAEELATELEKLLPKTDKTPAHRRRIVREVEKCRTKKEGIPELVNGMRETLRQILAFSEKLAGDFPQVLKKIRTAIEFIKKYKAKSQSDQKYYYWVKLICGGLCVVAAAVTFGAAVYVGIGVGAAAVGGTAAVAVGGYAYYSHHKTRELSDYLEELEEMEKAMGTIHGHLMKRQADWINRALGPAKKTDVDQGAVARRVVQLPSAPSDKQSFREEIEASLKTLAMFGEGIKDLEDTANCCLSFLATST